MCYTLGMDKRRKQCDICKQTNCFLHTRRHHRTAKIMKICSACEVERIVAARTYEMDKK